MKSTYQSLGMIIVATLLLLAGGLGLFWLRPSIAAAQSQGTSERTRTITVVGEGKVRVAPDVARINLGIETIGSQVKQTSSEAAATMEAMLTALEAQGIEGKDIQTSYYNIWVERPYGGPEGSQPSEPIYHVNNTVMVTVRDLNKITDVLGAVLDAGANTVNSIDFNVVDPSQLQAEAREKAVADALATAQELAGLAGVEVGEVVSVSEVVTAGIIPVSEAAAYAQGVGGGVGPISPGEVEVSTQLQVTYAIQ